MVEQMRGVDVIVSTIHPLVLQHRRPGPDPLIPTDAVDDDLRAFLDTFGLIVYDEIHIFGAPKFSRIFDLVQARYQLGLSATPERSDRMERVFELKVGPILNATKDLGITPPVFDVTVIPIVPPIKGVQTTEQRSTFADQVTSFTLNPSRIDFLIELLRQHLSRIQIGRAHV